jgi:hypothetical protein
MQLGTAAGPDSCWEPTCVGGSPHHTAVVAIYCQQQPLGQTYCNALRAGLWEQWGSSCACCKPYSNRPFLGHSSSSQPDMRRAMDTGLPPAAILLISWVLINSRNARSLGAAAWHTAAAWWCAAQVAAAGWWAHPTCSQLAPEPGHAMLCRWVPWSSLRSMKGQGGRR